MTEEDWDWFDEQDEPDEFDEEWGEDEGAVAGSVDDRIQAGAEHLRSAAREVIAASRALLDVAEELVEDPDAVRDLAGFIGSLGSLVGKGMGPWAPGSGRERSNEDPDDPDDPDDPRVERIPIS